MPAYRHVRRKRVHFNFSPHPRNETFPLKKPRKRTRTVLVEDPSGATPQEEFNRKYVESFQSVNGDIWTQTMGRYFEKALDTGKKIREGETGSEREVKHLEKLVGQIQTGVLPFNQLRKIVYLNARLNRGRHALIVRTVKNTLEKKEGPIEGTYGTEHSLLTRALQKEGIESSRTLNRKVFNWEDIAVRKLMLGEKMGRLSPLDMKRAYASRLLSSRNWPMGHSTRAVDFRSILDYELIRRLSKKQLNKIVEEQNAGAIWKENGMETTMNSAIAFLERNSFYWKRLSPAYKQWLIGKRKRPY